MEAPEYKNIFESEGSHFFYVANHKILVHLIEQYCGSKRKLKILDAGCGTGLLAKKLERFGQVQGIDINTEALRFAKKRGVKVKLASVGRIPFKDESFDLVTSIDVIYHKQVDDKKALREFFRVLRPGGVLVLRVPAVSWLGTKHDEFVHTRERYSRHELKSKLLTAGFKIEKLSFVNLLLVPPALIRHFWEKGVASARHESGVTRLPKPLNALLAFLLGLEALLFQWVDLPFGLGLIAVCRKPTR